MRQHQEHEQVLERGQKQQQQQQHASRPKSPTAEFLELHSVGYVKLPKEFSATRCRQLFGAAAREDYTGKEIFNGEAAGEQHRRFQSRSESWANAAERDMEMALTKHGLLCDGALLQVRTTAQRAEASWHAALRSSEIRCSSLKP